MIERPFQSAGDMYRQAARGGDAQPIGKVLADLLRRYRLEDEVQPAPPPVESRPRPFVALPVQQPALFDSLVS